MLENVVSIASDSKDSSDSSDCQPSLPATQCQAVIEIDDPEASFSRTHPCVLTCGRTFRNMRRLAYLRKRGLILGVLALLLATLVAVGVTLVITQANREQQQRLTLAVEAAHHASSTLAQAIRLAFTASKLALPYIQHVQMQIPTLNALLPVGSAIRNEVIYGMTTGISTLAQSRTRPNATESLILIRVPVFVNASSAAETWGWPANMTAPECASGALPCFNASSGLKWWGLLSITLGRPQMLQCDLLNNDLLSLGYGYTVSVRQDAPGLDSVFASLTPLITNLGSDQQCTSPTVESVDYFGTGLQIHVELCIVDAWTVPWVAPCIVLVVVLSIGLVLAAAFAIATWVKHSELVHALLPAPAIQHLMSNMPVLNDHKVLPGSPAEKLANLLGQLLEGGRPSTQAVVQLMAAIKQQADFYLPEDLQAHVLQAAGMDKEVAAALMAAVLPEAAAAKRAARGGTNNGANQSSCQIPEVVEFSDLTDALCAIMELVSAPTSADRALPATTSNDNKGSRKHLSFSVVDVNEELCKRASSLFSGNTSSHVHARLLTRLEQVLLGASTLSGAFDAFELHDASNGHPLAVLGMWVFNRSGLMQEFNIPAAELVSFLRAIEAGYAPGNGYHNSIHAADVLQSVHAMLEVGGMRGTYADGSKAIAVYLAAIVHDYEHRGRTNDFLVNTGDELAVRYNDRSPQENHHVSAAFLRLNQQENNFLRFVPEAQRLHLRKLVIDLVLATDMKQHFALCGLFTSVHRLQPGPALERIIRARLAKSSEFGRTSKRQHAVSIPTIQPDGPSQPLASPPASYSGTKLKHVVIHGKFAEDDTERISCPDAIGTSMLRERGRLHSEGHPNRVSCDVPAVGPASASGKATAAVLLSSSQTPIVSAENPFPVDDAECLLSLQMMLKICDLGHTWASLPVHLNWVKSLETEMFAQGDVERARGIPLSPLCDRTQIGITKSQVGFFDVVVLPLLASYTSRFPATKPILNSAASNYQYWRACADSPPR